MSRNPHPMGRCPYCGAAKPCVLWLACSPQCADLMRNVPRQDWSLPAAELGSEEPVSESETRVEWMRK